MGAIDDPARLAALERLDVIEGKPGAGFEHYTAEAAAALDVPVSMVSLVESDRQVFQSRTADREPWSSIEETPLSHSFCVHVIERKAPLVIGDAREDPLVRENPSVEELGVIAYAGAPIVTRDDQAVGTLCVMDREPRQWSEDQVRLLSDLAAAVGLEIEQRAAMRR